MIEVGRGPSGHGFLRRSRTRSLTAYGSPTHTLDHAVIDPQIAIRAKAKVSGMALAAGRAEIPAASAVPLTTASTPRASINLRTNKRRKGTLQSLERWPTGHRGLESCIRHERQKILELGFVLGDVVRLAGVQPDEELAVDGVDFGNRLRCDDFGQRLT